MALHRGQAVIDHRGDRGRVVVGQEVGDPDEAAGMVAGGEDLRARVVMGEPAADNRPCDALSRGVDVDDQFARDPAVCEGDDARARLEAAIGDEAGGKRVWRAPTSASASQTSADGRSMTASR
ncbi:MAG: hypothetical protein ABIQ33_11185 [Caldimonas sp.]